MTQATQSPVVVGVDGSTSAKQAVLWAAAEAGRRHAPLVLVHVWTPIAVAPRHAGALHPYHDMLVEQGNRWLQEAVSAAQEAVPDVTVTAQLASGTVAGHLIKKSAVAGLVVLGSRGLGGFAELVVGSIAMAVTTHGHCPVVVVRGPAQDVPPRQDGPVVVGVDGSPNSQAALSFAFETAALRGASLTVVHAWSDRPLRDLPMDWQLMQDESEALSRLLVDDRARYPDVPVEQVVVRDGPAHVLLEHARTAQLVVVGSRGRGGFRGLLLGSTSQAMIHHAACPVVVVPTAAP